MPGVGTMLSRCNSVRSIQQAPDADFGVPFAIVARGRDICVPDVCERFHLTLKGGAGSPPPADRAQHQTRSEQHSFRRKASNRASSCLQAFSQHAGNQRLPHSRAAFEAFFSLGDHKGESHFASVKGQVSCKIWIGMQSAGRCDREKPTSRG